MKNFSIFRNTNKKEGSTAPDYKMSVKVGEEYVECGACWLKEGKSGKYFSCKLSDHYLDREKNIAKKGFELTFEEELTPDTLTSPSEDYPKGLDTNSIPF